MKFKSFSEAVKYEQGTYCRIGNRIYLSGDITPPSGFAIKKDTKRIEPKGWINLVYGPFVGVSYEVEGWNK